ncbi:MAG TPA: T9SS type A sorting domain-containing protein, partial [Massilibacterium sp.]|nr:T9SS type A sorting domain-containing protein [Massilibacterium sp.]
GNGIAEPGEEFTLGINFINYLTPSSASQVTLESRSEYVSITQGSFTIGSAVTLEEINNYDSPFEFTISENIPQNEDVEFLIKYSGAGYNDFQLTTQKFNTTFLTQDGNDIALTIGSEGNLGFNDFGASPTEGDGLYFMNGDNLIYEGALIYGNSQTMVMDAAHIDNSTLSQDFNSIIPFSINVPGEYADYEGYTKFNDGGASPNLGIETELYTYSFTQEQYSSFIILRYKFFNTADTAVDHFHAGLFLDLDMGYYLDDYTMWDDTGKLGYVYDGDENSASSIEDKIAVALISDTKYGYRAFSNSDGTDPISPYGSDGFTEREKWYAIASAITNPEKGPEDIALGVSGGPYTIPPHDSLNVAFAIAGGYSLEELRTAIQNSREAYGLIPTSVRQINNELSLEFSLSQNYPNPFNPSTTIKFTIPSVVDAKFASTTTKVVVYDILGREIKTLINENLSPGSYEVTFDAYQLSSGVYFYRLSAGNFVETKKMILLR